MFLGAFPVENTVDVVLESEFFIRDNWLLLSNPKLPRVVQLAIRLGCIFLFSGIYFWGPKNRS